jgi:NADH-quinone oxidoreductase subunit N
MNEILAEFLRGYTATNQWLAILPEILLALLALSLLAVEMASPKAARAQVGRVAFYGQLFILAVCLIGCFTGPATTGAEPLFSGMIEQSGTTQFMRVFFLLCSLFVSYLGGIYLERQPLARTEFHHLVLLVAAGMMLLVQSAHFVMLFVALETVTVAFYVLVAYGRNSVGSLEAGLKYLIMGALSSAILLFGIVLLYGVAGNPALAASSSDSLQYSALAEFISLHDGNLLVRLGALLVVAGICFKIGAVPFQIWVPDVYQGAPTPVTSFLAVASKAAGFVVLLQLVQGPFAGLGALLVPVLSIVAAVTILFGNCAAVVQGNLKRLMGLSGIAHAGYLLLGVIAVASGVAWAEGAVLFYLFTYLLGSFAVFAVMTFAAGTDDTDQQISHYQDFAKEQPFLGGVLAIGLGSLAGIPPLGGFIGKLFLFIAAFQAGLYGLLGVAILGVVISIYYYFGWIREAFFSHYNETLPTKTAILPSMRDRLLLGFLAAASLLLGLYPAALSLLP